jgi:hypothetical protein
MAVAALFALVCAALYAHKAASNRIMDFHTPPTGVLSLVSLLLIVAVLPAYLAARIWKLFRRGPKSRWRGFDHLAVVAACGAAAVVLTGSAFWMVYWSLGRGSLYPAPALVGPPIAAAFSLLALRLHSVRARLVTPAAGSASHSPAQAKPASSYYHSLGTLAERRRITGPDTTPPGPLTPPRKD